MVLLLKNFGFKILEESSEPVPGFFGQVMTSPFLCCHSLQGSASLPMLRSSSRIWGRAASRSCRSAWRSLGCCCGTGDRQVTAGGQWQPLLSLPQGTDGGLWYWKSQGNVLYLVLHLGWCFFNIFNFFYTLITLIFCLADCFKPCTLMIGSSGKWKMMISSFLQHQKVNKSETDAFCVLCLLFTSIVWQKSGNCTAGHSHLRACCQNQRRPFPHPGIRIIMECPNKHVHY